MNAAMMLMCLTIGQPDKVVFQAPLISIRNAKVQNGEYLYALYNRVYMGRNYLRPKNEKDRGNPAVDFSRKPTTYFHDKSPIGVVLSKYNWFPGATNTFHADARLPASMIGMALDPWGPLVNLWSEPPIAVLGMDVGTLAAYARPAQTMHFTERVPTFVNLSMPANGKKPMFHYVQDALDRGANLRVFAGEPRAMIEKHGGEKFYQAIVVETYKLPVSGIHKELMTKEAIKMLMGKLREDGIICYHTSNRYYDLVPILASAAEELQFACIVGADIENWDRQEDRFSSEWVLIARHRKHLAHLKAPQGLKPRFGNTSYWRVPDKTDDKFVWTDRGVNSFRGVYRSDPDIDRFYDHLRDLEDFMRNTGGLSYPTTYKVTRPFHEFVRGWSARSARIKNGGVETPIERRGRYVVFDAPGIQVYTATDEGPGYSYLMYHGTYIGKNYHRPKSAAARGDPTRDRSRFPTTYFHDRSPLGVVMQKFNWFPGPENTFHADARLPASLTGMGDALGQLVHLWSEPPVAVVGMDVGSLAAYARPAQAMHFFERKPVFVELSDGKRPRFCYVEDARARGAAISIFQGEPRPSIAKRAGEGFYQLVVINTYKDGILTLHKDLMTKEGMRLLMSRTRAGGIVCFHSSNRYYDLNPILASTAKDAGYAVVVGTDTATWPDDRNRDRFTSWWVMVARKPADLVGLKAPPGYEKTQRWKNDPFWGPPTLVEKKFVWRDGQENSFRGVYRSDPTIDLFGNSVSKLSYWIADNTGIPSNSMYRMMDPVQGGIRAWSMRSAQELNRELPRKE